MNFKNVISIGTLISTLMSPAVMAASAQASEQHKKEIQGIVHEYLITNPEVLIEASQALQQKQQKQMQQQAQAGILKNVKPLFSDNIAVVGNPKGDVTLVEFFDYQCVHCKKMTPVIEELVSNNKNLRVVYKEFPIFGKNSENAAKAALAAAMQGKYKAMHTLLIKEDKRLTDEIIEAAAKKAGLDMTKFKADMNSKQVKDILAANKALAEKGLNLMGTPALIIASTPKGQFKEGSQPVFIPGAASKDALVELINKAKNK